MNVFSLIVGMVLLAICGYFVVNIRREAEWLQWWYNYMSEPDGRPWWRRGHFRPNRTHATIVAWLFILAGSALGLTFVLSGFGVDVGSSFE